MSSSLGTKHSCVGSDSLCGPVQFPYISSYLAFRELPLLVELLQAVAEERGIADVVMVDGSGVLHPRNAGIATMLGVLLDLPTIGVTKKRLVGTVVSATEPTRTTERGRGWQAIEWASEIRRGDFATRLVQPSALRFTRAPAGSACADRDHRQVVAGTQVARADLLGGSTEPKTSQAVI